MATTAPEVPRYVPAAILDRRQGLRAALSIPVMLETCGRYQTARLRNLSEHGALVESPMPLHRGDCVVVQAESLRAEGVVSWESQSLVGIAFRTRLDDREISRQILHSSIQAERSRTKS